jgi:hypothetical protein
MDDIRPAIPPGSNRFIDDLRRDLRDKGYAMGVISPVDG